MSTEAAEDLLRRAETLSPDELLHLAACLLERARWSGSMPTRRWQDLRGGADPPLVCGDAQGWISRARREADDRRESSTGSQR